MRALCAVASCLTFFTVCSALTIQLFPHDEMCFQLDVAESGKKVAFNFEVIEGGQFDIDYTVKDPQQSVVISGDKERQGEFIFAASTAGEYSICFSNRMSTVSEKVVKFDVHLENDPAKKVNKEDPSFNPLEEAAGKIRTSLDNIQRKQNHYRARENRNMATVVSTESRIFWFSVSETILIVTMGVIQVYIVRTFFNTRKGRAV